jgi:ribonuclease BN (tRNA processing enzyme)
MRLTVLGCCGSMPGPDSPAAGYLVQADGFSLGLDLGNGTFGVMQRHLDPLRLDALALSHLHPDHCSDVTALVVYRRYRPGRAADEPSLPLFGPSETAARIAAAYAPSACELATTDLSDVLDVRPLESLTARIGPFALAATPVAHLCEAYAMRVECDGTSLVYTGDTGPCRALEDLAAGADVLLAEATWTHDESRPPDVHMSGVQAGELATAAGVGRLLLTHIAPWTDPSAVLAEARQAFTGSVELVAAGCQYDLND